MAIAGRTRGGGLRSRFTLPALALVAAASAALGKPINLTVSTDPTTTFQTIQGWGGLMPVQRYIGDDLMAQIIDAGVNELGMNRFRLEMPAGYATDQQRWEWRNDNTGALNTNMGAFNTTQLDIRMTNVVLPIKQAVEAAGKPFDIYISQSFYTGGSSGEAPRWLQNPGEYAEYAMSYLNTLKNTYGVEANYFVVCNEAGNGNVFSEALVGRMIKTLGPQMEAAGLSTKIQFSEGVNPQVTNAYIDALSAENNLWRYVGLISFHHYGGQQATVLAAKAITVQKAAALGLPLAQTEIKDYGGSTGLDYTIDDIYSDIVTGNVSFEEVYGKGFPSANANRTSFTRSPNYWNYRQVFHYVEPGAVRVGSSSTDSNVKVMAFRKDGKQTTVFINNFFDSAIISLDHLPAGQYGLSQSVNLGATQELGLRTVGADGLLSLTISGKSVATLYPHAVGANWAPTVTDWKASDAYLKLGVNSSTTLSATAVDAELNGVTYSWSVVSTPAGAGTVTLATPNAASSTATGLTAAGQYKFAVTVNDGTNTVVKNVYLNVYNGEQAPQVELNIRQPVDLTLVKGSSTGVSTLLQSNVVDPDSSAFTYQWEVLSKPAGATDPTLAAPTANQTTISALKSAGQYVVRLTVSDGVTVTTRDMTLTVDPVNNNAPTITNLSATKTTQLGGTLSATIGDADGDAINAWWELVSGPESNVAFSNQSGATTGFITDTPGVYTFQLDVVDRTLGTTSSLVTLTLPEPGMMGLGAVVFVALGARRKRRC